MPTTAATTTRRKEPQSSKAGQPPASTGKAVISDLIEVLEEYLDPKEVKAVYEAYLFGADAHDGQRRRSGEAFISHPLSVALILADMRLDALMRGQHVVVGGDIHRCILHETGPQAADFRAATACPR